jgi:SAM-dependent methyltransferase
MAKSTIASAKTASRQPLEEKAAMAEHWPDIARLWAQVGPPLRPTSEDIAILTGTIDAWARDNGPPRALILGVTPELYSLPWPQGTRLLAADRTQGMIDVVWPGPRNAVIRTDWTAIPLKDGSQDIVLCDGGFHLMDHPNGHHKFIQSLHRIVAPGGLCVFRLFVPPQEYETPDQVLRDLLNGRISNLNILKIRLGMSLQTDIAQGVELGRVWNAIHQAAPNFEELALRTGWPLEHVLAINTYRNSDIRYFFLDLDSVRRLFFDMPGGFELVTVRVPVYELGDRCPTIVMRRLVTANTKASGRQGEKLNV